LFETFSRFSIFSFFPFFPKKPRATGAYPARSAFLLHTSTIGAEQSVAVSRTPGG
jgi:hypothetical protein